MTDWSTPQDVPEVAAAFGDVTGLLPEMDEIPAEFKRYPGTGWNAFQADWFFGGLKNPHFYPKDGIDADKALAHLSTIQRSFTPKHEHKAAAVAWLASLWFSGVRSGGKRYP